MLTYPGKKEAVLNQYFRQYLESISPAILLYNTLVPKYDNGVLNVMQTMFLCSVIDHFGKVMRVGDLGNGTPLNRGQNYDNFKFFIENYFPKSDHCKSDVIYKLFRNGVMHQFFPKASGIFWSNDAVHINKLLEDDNNTPRLNNLTFSNYIENGLNQIMHDLENDLLTSYVESIYQYLILTNYALNDHAVLRDLQNNYNNKGKTIYDAC